MNVFKIIGGFLLIFLIGACTVCRGDVVYLTTGEELTGTVIEETSESVRLKLDSGGMVRLEKKLVEGIRYTEAPGVKGGEKIRSGQPSQIAKIANIRNICKRLQGKPKDKNSLRKLQGTFEEIQDKDTKICLGCTLVMGYFHVGVDSTARKLRKSISRRFPGYPDLKLIQIKNLSVACEKCSGSGKLTVKCARCGGSGVCRMCSGKGKVESTFTKEIRKCPDCNGSGVCRKCKGSGKCVEICRKCHGKGSIISKTRIKRVYRQLLARSVDQLFTAEQTARGLVRFQDMWVTPEEKSAIEAEICADKDKAVKSPREEKRRCDAIASKDQIPKVIDGLLAAQKWGKIGTEYWEDPSLACKLPGVMDWWIIDQQVFGIVALVKVDTDSKIKGGSSVQKIWTFHMRYTDSWKVHLISE